MQPSSSVQPSSSGQPSSSVQEPSDEASSSGEESSSGEQSSSAEDEVLIVNNDGSASVHIYWVEEEQENKRPEASAYSQYALYYSIEGEESVRLTEESCARVGLEELPEVQVQDEGDRYVLSASGLPSKIRVMRKEAQDTVRTADQEENGSQYVEWEIRPQDEVSGYSLVWVDEDALKDPDGYPYAQEAGWYYVQDAQADANPPETEENGVKVVGWKGSYDQIVYWADEQNKEGLRPLTDSYALPKLYFTYKVIEISGTKDGEGTGTDADQTPAADDGMEEAERTELSEADLERLGMKEMPQFGIQEREDSYILTLGGNTLPTEIVRTDNGQEVRASIEWEIELQEVEGYLLVEVTEEELQKHPENYPYASQAGTYYVIEIEDAEENTEESLDAVAYLSESSRRVYWVDYNDAFGTRPEGIVPELYFTMTRTDGETEGAYGGRQQLTQENLSMLGLDSMPAFRIEDMGEAVRDGSAVELSYPGQAEDEVYTVEVWQLILDGDILPTRLVRTEGDEKTEYQVEWEILPPEAAHYSLLEVDADTLEEAAQEYAYVTDEGWYYALDLGEEISLYADEAYTNIEKSETVTQDIYWVDNGDENGGRPLLSDFGAELTFTMTKCDAGGNEIEPEEKQSGSLNEKDWTELLKLEAPCPEISMTQPNASAYLASAELPSLIRQHDIYGEDTYWKIDWQWKHTDVPGYQFTEVTDANLGDYPSIAGSTGTGWYYVEETDLSFQFVLRTGSTLDGLSQEQLENVWANIAGQFSLTYQAGKKDGTLPLDGDVLKELLHIEISGQTGVRTITVTMEGIQKYNLDGKEIPFRLHQDENKDALSSGDMPSVPMEENDVLKVEYDNTSVPNHGGDQSGVYSGGTVNLTLEGLTSYQAHKAWLDPKGSVRPSGEFQLWRFVEGTDPGSAAAVWDENGIIHEELDTAQDTYLVDFGNVQLPKYNAEGYKYIYVAREYLNQTGEDSYTQIFGSIDSETGEIKDTLVGTTTRGENDINLYYDGTLSNRISGTVQTKATKTWMASAFQAEFEDVTVVFKLQSRQVGEENWEDVTNENGEVVTEKIEGFSAEELSGISFEKSAAKFDEQGRQLQYRWVESEIRQGADTTNLFTPDGNGGGTFTLVQDDGRQIQYVSRAVTSEEAPYTTVITNSVVNTISYEVEKVWDRVDPEPVTIYLYRTISGEELAKPFITLQFDENGNVAEFKVEESLKTESDSISNNGQPSWKTLIDGLAEYDEHGRQYEYYLLEDTTDGGHFPTYETSHDKNGNYQTKVINAPGEGYRVMVRKHWIDDSDTLHRGNVTFTAYNKDTNEPINWITLSDGVWYGYIGLKNNKPEDVYVLETQIDGTPAYYMDGENRVELIKNPKNPENINEQIIAENENHRYEVTYAEEKIAGETFRVITNRRLGNVDLTVEKTWFDGKGQGRQALQQVLSENGYQDLSLYIRLEFADETAATPENGYKINYDKNKGSVTINKGSAQPVPILDSSEQPVGSLQEVDLDGPANPSSYTFFNLPKYDTNGTTVRYTVDEVWMDTGGEVSLERMASQYPELYKIWKEYQVQIEEVSYEVKDGRKENDKQEISITNRRSYSKEVSWHKSWKDWYNYYNSKRPDIYLDIYQLVHEAGSDEPILKLYQANYKWEYSQEHGGNVATDWNAVFSQLPKYDAQGYEIIYYAVENTHVDAGQFEYEEVSYLHPEKLEDSGFIGTQTNPDSGAIAAGMVWEIKAEGQGSGRYALKEGGTFTNQIASSIELEGQKIWQGIPADFDEQHLPTIVFELYQSLDGGSETKVAEVEMSADQAAATRNRYRIAYLGKNSLQITGDGNWSVGWDPSTAYPQTDATTIPKYSEDGSLYTYTVKERINWAEWAASEIKGDTDGSHSIYEEGDKAEGDYSYTITNLYSSPKGEIQAAKSLYLDANMLDADPAAGAAYFPAVTLELYRRYPYGQADTAVSAWALVESQTWTAEQIKGAYEGQGLNASGGWLDSHAFVFEEKEIYAPNGAKYEYEVREVKTTEGAYETWIAKGSVQKGTEGEQIKGTPAIPVRTQDGAPWYVAFPAETDAALYAQENAGVTVTFLNKPKAVPDRIALKGSKEWEDLENRYGTRPKDGEEIKGWFKLYRRTEAPQGGSAIEEEVPEGYTIEWTSTSDDTWEYKVNGELERNASNDMPWIYIMKETVPADSPYTPSPNPGTGENGDKTARAEMAQPTVEGGVLTGTIAPLTNSILTRKPFQKQWEDTDGNPITEDYLGYYWEITFKLQVREKGKDGSSDSEWKDAKEYFDGQSYEPAGIQYTKTLESGSLTDPIWGTGNAFESLPTVIRKTDSGELTNLEWRVVEDQIQYGTDVDNPTVIDVWVPEKTGDTYTYQFKPDGGMVLPGYVNGNSNSAQTVIHVNKIQTTEFSVTKTWAGDASNAYGTRPGTEAAGKTWETWFVIQRKTDNTDWANVESNGTPLVVVVTGTNDDASVSTAVSGLPAEDMNGDDYSYRALELQPDHPITGEQDLRILQTNGAIYNTAYKVAYSGEGTGNVTATNTMTFTALYAEKDWVGGETASVTLDLQYLTAEDASKDANWKTLASVTLNGQAVQTSGVYGEYEAWKARFTNIPSRMPGSYLEDADDWSCVTRYRIRERNSSGYVPIGEMKGTGEEGNPYLFTNTVTTSLIIQKEWVQTTAHEIEVTVYRTQEPDPEKWSDAQGEQYLENGKAKTVVLNAQKNWTETVSGLPKYDADGKRYYYFAVEENAGTLVSVIYEHAILDPDGEKEPTQTTITNIGLADISGTKTWRDNANAYKTRPAELELKLYRTISTEEWDKVADKDWEEVSAVPEWTDKEKDVWTYVYRALPKADPAGNVYTYKVEEVTPQAAESEAYGTVGDEYQFSRDEKNDPLNLINTLTGERKITVKKNWDDNNDSGRPKEIVVKLTGTVNDGSQTPVVVYEQEITLKPSLAQKLLNGAILEEPSHWKMTLSGLPKYDTQQRRITYNVTEIKIPGYDVYEETAVDSGDSNHEIFTFTNRKYGSLTVSKNVTGSDGDKEKDWQFTVKLGGTLAGFSGKKGEMEFTDGTASFALKHGESITATDLNAGVSYTVTEQEANQGGYTTSCQGEAGTIPAGDTARASFTNHKDKPSERTTTGGNEPDPGTPEKSGETKGGILPIFALPGVGILPELGNTGVPTWDASNPLFYIVLALAAAAVIAVILRMGGKRNGKKPSGKSRRNSRRKSAGRGKKGKKTEADGKEE